MSQQDNINRRIFEQLGEDLPRSLAQVIQEAADLAVEDMRGRMNFKTNTPGTGVRDSVRAVVDEATLTLGITMPEHGYFQNFGVVSYGGKGRNTDQEPIDGSTASAFGASEGSLFQFGTGNYSTGSRPWGAYYSGLDAKRFLDVERFVNDVATYVNNNLEL